MKMHLFPYQLMTLFLSFYSLHYSNMIHQNYRKKKAFTLFKRCHGLVYSNISVRQYVYFVSITQTTHQRDTLLLPRFIQKHVISYLNVYLLFICYVQNIVLYEWNPLSIREASLLKKALSEVASYFNTVTSELRLLYASVTQRIQHAIQSTVYFVPSLLSGKSNDIQTDAQEITELYIMRGIRV